MLLRSRPPDIEIHLKINSTEITKVTATKLFGIIIYDRLNWKPYIQSVNCKLSNILSAGMSTSFCSLFQPYISYRNEIWGNNYASNVNCQCIIQRKAVRLICNADRIAHTNEFFK